MSPWNSYNPKTWTLRHVSGLCLSLHAHLLPLAPLHFTYTVSHMHRSSSSGTPGPLPRCMLFPPIWHNSLHTFAGRPSSSFGSSLTIQKSHPCYSSIPFSFSWSMCSFVYMEGWTSSWSPQEQQTSLDHHCNPRTQHKVAQRVVTQEVFLPIHRWGN